MNDLAIDVAGLNKSFGGRPAVHDFAIQVRRGSICGFLGPNGSGKTTTIRMLCGLLTPDSGTGTCLGFDILRESAAIKREVGYMTQRFSFYEDLSIRENLDFVARVYGVANRAAVVDATIERLGLTQRQRQLAGALSGGWKQRLALAACILHQPQLLLLDEPTAGVDPKARRDFWDQIHRLAGDGMTVLVSTHYMDEAERCHDIAYLAHGRLLTRGTVDEVIRNAGIETWEVTTKEAGVLGRRLEQRPGIDTVAAFGDTLHVSGADPDAFERAIAEFRNDPAQHWTKVEPGLEDVFIALMRDVVDARQ